MFCNQAQLPWDKYGCIFVRETVEMINEISVHQQGFAKSHWA